MNYKEEHKIDERYKLLFILVLIIGSFLTSYYFIFILETTIVYSHIFYVPTILSCLWWKYKGLIVPASFSVMMLFLPLFSIGVIIGLDNLIRAILLICVGLVVSYLSNRIFKAELELKGRVSELNCLYGINKAINNPNSSVDEILNGTLERIRCGWQYPKLACARIIYDHKEYKTNNFKSTPWKITDELDVKDKNLKIEINYLQEIPFRTEEITLLKEILEQLKIIFELKLIY